jgi:hypothetical protein
MKDLINQFKVTLDFKKEDFVLDFSSVCSDKSTTDNFVSDEDHHQKSKIVAKREKRVKV